MQHPLSATERTATAREFPRGVYRRIDGHLLGRRIVHGNGGNQSKQAATGGTNDVEGVRLLSQPVVPCDSTPGATLHTNRRGFYNASLQ
jgi:hypothetical protein